ncbi:MAG: hypothetical protein WC755_05405 [Candidatus Woesearchaeota archaeon]|jgi:hypothetical protein
MEQQMNLNKFWLYYAVKYVRPMYLAYVPRDGIGRKKNDVFDKRRKDEDTLDSVDYEIKNVFKNLELKYGSDSLTREQLKDVVYDILIDVKSFVKMHGDITPSFELAYRNYAKYFLNEFKEFKLSFTLLEQIRNEISQQKAMNEEIAKKEKVHDEYEIRKKTKEILNPGIDNFLKKSNNKIFDDDEFDRDKSKSGVGKKKVSNSSSKRNDEYIHLPAVKIDWDSDFGHESNLNRKTSKKNVNQDERKRLFMELLLLMFLLLILVIMIVRYYMF